MPELDNYEQAGMDNDNYDAMGMDQRRDAERELDQDHRMRETGKQRGPAAFADDEELSGDEGYARRGQARMMRGAEEVEEDGELGNLKNIKDYGEAKEPLNQWVRKREVISYIQKAFGAFLRSFAKDGVQGLDHGGDSGSCRCGI